MSTGIDITILGDLNMDYRKRSAAYYKQIKDFEKTYELRQLITDCTRITNKSKSLLDLIFTNIEHVSEFGTLNFAISDHQLVYMIKKKPREKHETLTTHGHSYITFNKIQYQQTIKDNVCWQDFWTDGKTVNELWHIMYNCILAAANVQCPEKDIRLKNLRPGWMTIDTVEALNDKYRLYRLAKSTMLEQDWINYRNAPNHAARLMKNTKEQLSYKNLKIVVLIPESCGENFIRI